LPAWGNWGAIAIQAYGEFVAGSPPFYKYPALGGSNRMRGYFYGRYRDKAYVMEQAEYRRHNWWKLGGILTCPRPSYHFLAHSRRPLIGQPVSV
jgi:hypothetical protein